VKLVDGQVAVVTGAASGIGRSLATQLSSRGLAVVLADLPGDRLEEATALASEAGGEALAVACDVRHRPDVEALAARVLERCGRVDLVCLNAGVLHDAAPLWALDPAVVDQVLAVNLYGVLHGVGALVPLLVAQGSGHVLLTASMSGVARTRYVGAYATSKFAVVGLAESLAGELGEQAPGVGVTVVCPGMVRTPLTAPMLGPLPEPGQVDPVDSPSVLDPDVVAARMLEGVEADELYVMPSVGTAARIEERTADMLGAIARSGYGA
jgi:NAD(P)-dependent dehydrogenase (short-subunit alcohol dehydrogenase family)